MAQRAIFSLFEYKSTTDRLKRCQLRSPVSAINIWWSAAILITPTAWPSTNVCSSYRPRRNYLMRVCQRQRRHLCESLREWLLVPPFTRAFLKSPSSRGLSAIAELLVFCNSSCCSSLVAYIWVFTIKTPKWPIMCRMGHTLTHSPTMGQIGYQVQVLVKFSLCTWWVMSYKTDWVCHVATLMPWRRPSYGDCLEVKREYYQNCCVLDCVTQCSQSAAHLYEQFLQVRQIGFVALGPLCCA